ncbi:universal stress protein UspA [Halobacteriales archaeon QS_8_69_26]|nr:MAG: universal stress protein UspA [Halobacteriales archaeon QS_8_69_26]
MTDLLNRLVVPVAEEDDARRTARGLRRHVDGDRPSELTVVYVVEKAGGAPDAASVEQREQAAEEAFAAFREAVGDLGDVVETEVLYGTDVAETIFEAAEEHDATAIAFTPRGGGRLIRLLTGDVALSLITETDRPVVVLPDEGDQPEVPERTDSPDETESPEGPDSPSDSDDSDEESV